jgi:hypothetical protein
LLDPGQLVHPLTLAGQVRTSTELTIKPR